MQERTRYTRQRENQRRLIEILCRSPEKLKENMICHSSRLSLH
jgi:hypothetical protein